ncbi:hypothetical protein HanRHA438_Chr17g0839951 [Helianthus annuus]|nr:hypothetical protein HanRHA438_Chr17g0839951 [Helianthus annuus]
MGKPPLIMDMFGKQRYWLTRGLRSNLWFSKQTFITGQPTVNSLNFVVDSLLHVLQAFRYMLLELAVWDAGVVMGQVTRNHKTSLMDFIHLFFGTYNKL